MATYVYRCPEHGLHEVSRTMGTAPAAEGCPSCAAVSPRVFTAPRLTRGSAVHRALLDRTGATADSPAVVAAPPPVRRPPVRSADSGLSRLPRP
jgi:hypothetical protein